MNVYLTSVVNQETESIIDYELPVLIANQQMSFSVTDITDVVTRIQTKSSSVSTSLLSGYERFVREPSKSGRLGRPLLRLMML